MLMRNAEHDYRQAPVRFELTASVVAGISAAALHWIETIRQRRRLAAARVSLAELSDATLADIGLSRADVGPRPSDLDHHNIQHRGL